MIASRRVYTWILLIPLELHILSGRGCIPKYFFPWTFWSLKIRISLCLITLPTIFSWAWLFWTFWPHEHTYIRPLLIHSEPFVVRSKEAISLHCYWSKSKTYDWPFANWDYREDSALPVFLLVLFSGFVKGAFMHTTYLLCTSNSLTPGRDMYRRPLHFVPVILCFLRINISHS